VGAEEVFGGSKVRTVACGHETSYEHTLALTEAGELWAWGRGAQGRLVLNNEQGRLVPTRVDPKHFAHAPISAVAAGQSHSAAVTAGVALYTWGRGEGGYSPGAPAGARRPGHADLAHRLVPTLVPRQLLGGARVGRCHELRAKLALAFAMGTHERLGAGSAAAGGGGGRRRSRRAVPSRNLQAGREEKGCLYLMMPAELVKRVVEACGWRAGGELGEGVVRLMGGRRTSGEI
jgi:hypothetical protein